jgi:hypothetical protein
MARRKGSNFPFKLVTAVTLLVGLPISLLLVQQQQNTRQEASTIYPTPSGVCKTGLNSFSVSTTCGTGMYRYAYYKCYDGFSGKMGSSTSCKSTYTWKQYAQSICSGRSSCSLTPTKVPSGYPTHTPTRTPTPAYKTPTPTPVYKSPTPTRTPTRVPTKTPTPWWN